MNAFRHRKLSVLAGLAALAGAAAAEAIIIHGFPIFSVVNGAQTAELNAVLVGDPNQDSACPVTLSFIDRQGNTVGDPNIFQLRGGAAVEKRFIGDPNTRLGTRLAIRAQVAFKDPNEFPACAQLQTSVEVVNRLTNDTSFILTHPAVIEIAPRQ
ncbi:MAG TPA: hypothetical protein VFY95_10755 [Sphingomicrobium sp.]